MKNAEREVELAPGQVLVTSTDPQGRITFANDDFIAISGFSAAELIGAPHNIIRHPDMPKQAFADMWSRLKAGKGWRGLVKNAIKGGGFYWVEANIAPVIENGQVTGFISVRSKPSRESIAEHEQLYAALRNGALAGARLDNGELVKTGYGARLRKSLFSIGARINLAFGLIALGMLLQGGLSMWAQNRTNHANESLYEDGAVLISQMAQMGEIQATNAFLLDLAALEISAGQDPTKRADQVKKNIQKLNELFGKATGWLKNDEERQLFASYTEKRNDYRDQLLLPALAAIEQKDFEKLRKLLIENQFKRFNGSINLQHEAVSLEIRQAGEVYET
jgi:methyl-accepting chemotaxis protein/aerotaxis receptor